MQLALALLDFLLRAAYQPSHWRHRIARLASLGGDPAGGGAGDSSPPWTVSGPLCFAGDVIARGVSLPGLEAGDWLVVHDVGAYTLSMWSRHCNRAMPPVIGYRDTATGPELTLLREGERVEDVVRMWSRTPDGPADPAAP